MLLTAPTISTASPSASQTKMTLVPAKPASGAFVVSRTATDDRFEKDAAGQETSTPAYMTGMTPADLVNPALSVAQRTALKMIAWYQRKTRKIDADGHIHNTHGMCCRFYPSCSTYTAQSIKQDGFIKGVAKGFLRTAIKCNPLQPVIHEVGFYRALQISGRTLLASLAGRLGLSVYKAEREQFYSIFQRVAAGEKIYDPA